MTDPSRPGRGIDIAVGLFVALGLAALMMLALKVSGLASFGEPPGYRVEARFQNVGGLKVRSPVTMAGVRVGQVAGIRYDSETYEAVVSLKLDARFDRIPEDTSAKILTSGLLGEQYVGLEPGGAPDYLEAGDQIQLTQSALVLENVIGQFLYQAAEGGAP